MAVRNYTVSNPLPRVSLEFPNGKHASFNGGLYIEYVTSLQSP